ncbi:MAG: Clp protease ClpP [Gammaproteobacteria bacterium]|nr:Clp protease ClpP [Gammaproteobacteria bacterium]
MKWFKAQAMADNPRKAIVSIDKPIGSDWAPDWISDFTGEQPAREFIAAVDGLGELDEITLEINSPGGDVASGVRIYNYLRNHTAKVHTRVTGAAASIATIIMMAGDTRSMAIGSTIMTHRASGLMMGFYNAQEMEETAKNLKTIDAAMVDIYAATTGKDKDAIAALLDQGDTFLGSDEAIEWGFATEADAQLKAVACADPKLFMKQLEQAGEIATLKAKLAGAGNETITAADALALAFDMTPEEAEAQAADLGDQIIALRQQQPASLESLAVTAEWVQENAPSVADSLMTQAVAAERNRITAIVKACQTTGQAQLMEKLIANGMDDKQASEYIYDVAAAHGNRFTIHNSHSPEGGHRKGIDYDKIYARHRPKQA